MPCAVVLRSVSPELSDMFARIFVPDPLRRAKITDLLRHPWTIGRGNPAEIEALIAQMDKTMVTDERSRAKVAAAAAAAPPPPWVDLENFCLDVDLDVDLLDQDLLMDELFGLA